MRANSTRQTATVCSSSASMHGLPCLVWGQVAAIGPHCPCDSSMIHQPLKMEGVEEVRFSQKTCNGISDTRRLLLAEHHLSHPSLTSDHFDHWSMIFTRTLPHRAPPPFNCQPCRARRSGWLRRRGPRVLPMHHQRKTVIAFCPRNRLTISIVTINRLILAKVPCCWATWLQV